MIFITKRVVGAIIVLESMMVYAYINDDLIRVRGF